MAERRSSKKTHADVEPDFARRTGERLANLRQRLRETGLNDAEQARMFAAANSGGFAARHRKDSQAALAQVQALHDMGRALDDEHARLHKVLSTTEADRCRPSDGCIGGNAIVELHARVCRMVALQAAIAEFQLNAVVRPRTSYRGLGPVGSDNLASIVALLREHRFTHEEIALLRLGYEHGGRLPSNPQKLKAALDGGTVASRASLDFYKHGRRRRA